MWHEKHHGFSVTFTQFGSNSLFLLSIFADFPKKLVKLKSNFWIRAFGNSEYHKISLFLHRQCVYIRKMAKVAWFFPSLQSVTFDAERITGHKYTNSMHMDWILSALLNDLRLSDSMYLFALCKMRSSAGKSTTTIWQLSSSGMLVTRNSPLYVILFETELRGINYTKQIFFCKKKKNRSLIFVLFHFFT